MTYISVGRRFAAILVDGLVGLLWLAPLGDWTSEAGTFRYRLNGGPFLLSLALWVGYFTGFEATVGGTPGKLALGIRVVRQDGSKLDVGAALVRSLLRFVDAFPYVLPYLVGAIAVWNSPTRQRIGDRVAGSVVIQAGTNVGVRSPADAPPVPPPPPPG